MVDALPSVTEGLAAVRAAGGRVTAAKRLVLEVLARTDQHLTAEEITTQVQHVAPDTSPSTVYRNLEEFEQLGILVHAHMGRAAAVYHLTGALHGHLVCQDCGATIEIPAATFEPLVRTLQKEYHFDVDRHHLALGGRCAACAS